MSTAEETAEDIAEGTTGGATGSGDSRVDAALEQLADLENLPVSEHVSRYDAVHSALQDALASLDEG